MMADKLPQLVPRTKRTAAWLKLASECSKALGYRVTLQQCQKRAAKLIQYARAKDLEALRVSGTSEEYNEREQLLDSILELLDNAEAIVR